MHLKLAQPRCTPARLAAASYGSQGDIRARRWTEKQHCHNLHFFMQASCQCLSACEFLGPPQHTTQLLASLGHITELVRTGGSKPLSQQPQWQQTPTFTTVSTPQRCCLLRTCHGTGASRITSPLGRIVVSASGKVSCGYLTTYYDSSHPSLRTQEGSSVWQQSSCDTTQQVRVHATQMCCGIRVCCL